MGSHSTSTTKHRTSNSKPSSSRRGSSSSSSSASSSSSNYNRVICRWFIWLVMIIGVALCSGAVGGYLEARYGSFIDDYGSLPRRLFSWWHPLPTDTLTDGDAGPDLNDTNIRYPRDHDNTPTMNTGVGPAGSTVVTHRELEQRVRSMVENTVREYTRDYVNEADVTDIVAATVPKVVAENIENHLSEDYIREQQRRIQENITAHIEQRMTSLETAQQKDRTVVADLRQEMEEISEYQRQQQQQQQQQQEEKSQELKDSDETLSQYASKEMLEELRGAVSELHEGLGEVSEQMAHMREEHKTLMSASSSMKVKTSAGEEKPLPEALYGLMEQVAQLEQTLTQHSDAMDTTAVQAARGEMERRLTEFRKVLSQIDGMQRERDRDDGTTTTTTSSSSSSTDLDAYVGNVEHMMKRMLAIHEADRIGRTDWALASVGGRVAAASPNYQWRAPWSAPLQWLKNTWVAHPPETVLDPDTTLGQCWAFPGAAGFVEIVTPAPVIPTAFSVDHVPRSIAVNTGSTPRQIQVWGYVPIPSAQQSRTDNIDADGKILLASYEYQIDGDSVQTFFADESKTIDPTVKNGISKYRVEVLDNHGEKHYTCFYRFRVHGYRPDYSK